MTETELRERLAEMTELLCEKRAAYGSTIEMAIECWRVFWPNGILPEAYTDAFMAAEILKKIGRVSQGQTPDQRRDGRRDAGGYGLLWDAFYEAQDGAAVTDVPVSPPDVPVLINGRICTIPYAEYARNIIHRHGDRLLTRLYASSRGQWIEIPHDRTLEGFSVFQTCSEHERPANEMPILLNDKQCYVKYGALAGELAADRGFACIWGRPAEDHGKVGGWELVAPGDWVQCPLHYWGCETRGEDPNAGGYGLLRDVLYESQEGAAAPADAPEPLPGVRVLIDGHAETISYAEKAENIINRYGDRLANHLYALENGQWKEIHPDRTVEGFSVFQTCGDLETPGYTFPAFINGKTDRVMHGRKVGELWLNLRCDSIWVRPAAGGYWELATNDDWVQSLRFHYQGCAAGEDPNRTER